MNKNCLLAVASLLLMSSSFAQNIGINADGSRPNSNAILDIKSGTKGLLIPRMDSLARNAIPNTKGLLVYDISTDKFWYNTGKGWECIPNDKDRGKGGDAWLLKGNGNTTDTGSFLGTTNNVPLNIRVNNQPSGRIDSASGSTFWGYHTGGNYSRINSDNTAIGQQSLNHNTGGFANTGVGFQTLYSNTTGTDNTAVGIQALLNNVNGFSNTATGTYALYYNTSGYENTANGFSALNENQAGLYNTADGAYALFSNNYGNYNVAVGSSAMLLTTSGSGNTAIGGNALRQNTTGELNTVLGYQTMYFNTIGTNNTATGTQSLEANTSGSYNAAHGFQALSGNTSGSYNTADGELSMLSNLSGSSNTAIGAGTMWQNNTGNNNTAIGFQANVSTDGLSNATAIGNGAIVDASNKVRIGNSAVTVIEGQVPFTTPSDGRYKFNVEENVGGLDFILHLRPVTYQFDVRRFDAQMQHQPVNGAGNYALQAGYDEATRIRRSGFIAQEVEKAANDAGYDFSGIIRPKTEQDHYSLSYDAFVVPLVKAVQEQQQIIRQQNKRLEEQDKKLTALQAQLDDIKKLLQPAN